ncbi:hypothetical protein LNTAR_16443 [Lentisphaera araneosa HTCC2155]|uniref:Uncharacterized protein n=1 Tax=Lentisphaera araneosa HTCC2155 TaxID=313628 RepID=A6DQA3_9BACT|nr:AAA family ATPase [Lentisphaera araneosa]EDM26154.1 hypothetical protein LNTAR_16443 [Lentisphaera araneosa HTCC2155]
MKNRIKQLIKHLQNGLLEREEIIALILLGAITRSHIFMLGVPGTAKSLGARRASFAFKDVNYFETLMHRFSTPEEVFGPISLNQLKQDKYIRMIVGYLPDAEIAFLDEIWKSSPSVLNTLLTVTNERLFRNGNKSIKVPLISMVTASNETPEPGQGLEALYDRMLIRLSVSPLRRKNNFEKLLQGSVVEVDTRIPEELAISVEEIDAWQAPIQSVKISNETWDVIHLIRHEIQQLPDEQEVEVSDRRWKSAASLLKASAFFCDRSATNHADVLLLRHCLWSTEENYKPIQKIVEKAVRDCGINIDIDLSLIDVTMNDLESEINDELIMDDDIYMTEIIDDQEYFKSSIETIDGPGIEVLIDAKYIKKDEEFNPCDLNGNIYEDLVCNFHKQRSCKLSGGYTDEYDDYYDVDAEFTAQTIIEKGTRRTDFDIGYVQSLCDQVGDVKVRLGENLEYLQSKIVVAKDELNTPFVPEQVCKVAIKGMHDQKDGLMLRIKECDCLISMCEESLL